MRAKALADPTRMQIALALREGEELCVCDLAWIIARPRTSSATTYARSAMQGSPTRAATQGRLLHTHATGRELIDAHVTVTEVCRVSTPRLELPPSTNP